MVNRPIPTPMPEVYAETWLADLDGRKCKPLKKRFRMMVLNAGIEIDDKMVVTAADPEDYDTVSMIRHSVFIDERIRAVERLLAKGEELDPEVERRWTMQINSYQGLLDKIARRRRVREVRKPWIEGALEDRKALSIA